MVSEIMNTLKLYPLRRMQKYLIVNKENLFPTMINIPLFHAGKVVCTVKHGQKFIRSYNMQPTVFKTTI
jgi:hypothetical protein